RALGRSAVRRPPARRRAARTGVRAAGAGGGRGRRVALRLRLAHRRRPPVAFRRNDRLPQRDRALAAAATDRGAAEQPQRAGAVRDRDADRRTVPGVASPKKETRALRGFHGLVLPTGFEPVLLP